MCLFGEVLAVVVVAIVTAVAVIFGVTVLTFFVALQSPMSLMS